MINLAGNFDCDETIREELKLAGIKAIGLPCRLDHEVPASIIGTLGPIQFHRAWYYWIANGPVPLEMALRLYADEEGRKNVRVSGHCGCPPPDKWTHWLDADGRECISEDELLHICGGDRNSLVFKRLTEPDSALRVLPIQAEVERVANRFITTYHIDSQAGLNLFASEVRAAIAKAEERE